MKKLNKIIAYCCVALIVAIIFISATTGCTSVSSSDKVQAQQQEVLAQESNSQVGMPSIKNFREKKILKDIQELCDQEGIVTYTYIYSQMTGKFTYIGETIGYGIPYATQFTNPDKIVTSTNGNTTLPQMDPNGLFKPATADGTWILMLDPTTQEAMPQYIEEKISTFSYKLPDTMLNK